MPKSKPASTQKIITEIDSEHELVTYVYPPLNGSEKNRYITRVREKKKKNVKKPVEQKSTAARGRPSDPNSIHQKRTIINALRMLLSQFSYQHNYKYIKDIDREWLDKIYGKFMKKMIQVNFFPELDGQAPKPKDMKTVLERKESTLKKKGKVEKKKPVELSEQRPAESSK